MHEVAWKNCCMDALLRFALYIHSVIHLAEFSRSHMGMKPFRFHQAPLLSRKLASCTCLGRLLTRRRHHRPRLGYRVPPSARRPSLQPGRLAVTSDRKGADEDTESVNFSDGESGTRRRAAAGVLRLAGQPKLHDTPQEKTLREAITTLADCRAPRAWSAISSHHPAADRSRQLQRTKTRLLQSLSPHLYPIPDVEGSRACRCSLAVDCYGQRFRAPAINSFLVRSFQALARSPLTPCFKLNRFDLFHAHIFIDRASCQPGLLFHAQEFPSLDPVDFPLPLGFCQAGSRLQYDSYLMQRRNLLWWNNMLHMLDVGPTSLLHEELLMEGLADLVYTVDEADFGIRAADVFYFDTLLDRIPEDRLFICPL